MVEGQVEKNRQMALRLYEQKRREELNKALLEMMEKQKKQ